MKVHLQYGQDGLEVELPDDAVVLEPKLVAGLADEEAAMREALRRPIGARPLRELVGPRDRVAVVIPDITRPLPSERLLPWLFAECGHVPAENVTVIVGTGSHRPNTAAELDGMLGREVARRYRVVNHVATDAATLEPAGRTADGRTVRMNREYVRADKRIVLGFIEPHFMAGFSGGYKAVCPGVVDIDTIMRYHRAEVIGDPRSAWGVLEGNPTQAQVREIGALLPVDFCINVTINRRRRITRFFCGDTLRAHEQGCAFARATAMAPCARPFPIVVTTNGGYPLDQNLYQTVKGMSAAAQIVTDGGLIVTAARCNDGFPSHGNFRALLFDHPSPQAILDTVLAPGFSRFDQWEAQLLAMIRLKARVALRSEIPDEDVRRAHLEPAGDIGACVARERARLGGSAPVAVLPEGPLTIPYLAAAT